METLLRTRMKRASAYDGFAVGLVAASSLSVLIASVYDSTILRGLPRGGLEITIALLPLIGLVLSWGTLQGRRARVGPIGLAASYAVVTLIATMLHPQDASLATSLSPAAIALVFAFVGSLLSAREFFAIGRAIVAIALVQVLLAVAEVQLQLPWAIGVAATEQDGYLIRQNLIMDGFLRASGAAGHPILLGVGCTVGILFAASPRTVRSLRVRMLIVAILAWGVLLSGSRSSVAALALAVVVALVHPNSPVRRDVRVVLLLAAVPLAVVYVLATLDDAREVSPFSLSNRVSALSRFASAMNRPLGEMLFGQARAFALETVADNQFLTTTGRFGIAGLIVILGVIVVGVTARRPLVSAAFASLAFLFLSFEVLSFGYTAILFWFLAGAARPFDGNGDGDRQLEARPRRLRSARAVLR